MTPKDKVSEPDQVFMRYLPEHLREARFRTILALPDLMKDSDLVLAPRLMQFWLYGELGKGPQLRRDDRAGLKREKPRETWPYILLDPSVFADSPTYTSMKRTLLGRRRQIEQRVRLSQVPLQQAVTGTEAPGKLQANQLRKILAKIPDPGSRAAFGEFATPVDQELFLAQTSMLGRQSLALENGSLMDALTKPAEITACLGSFNMVLVGAGEALRVDATTAKLTLNRLGFRVPRDPYDFSGWQPLGGWDRDQPKGWSRSVFDIANLRNQDFEDFEARVKQPFNEVVDRFGSGISKLVCQEFWVHTLVEEFAPKTPWEIFMTLPKSG